MKAAVKIPVIGNGDVKRVEDIEKIKQYTGCNAVMIGRAALANPWIFSRLNRSDYWTVSIWATSHEEAAKFQNKKPFHVSMKIDLTCAPAKRMF